MNDKQEFNARCQVPLRKWNFSSNKQVCQTEKEVPFLVCMVSMRSTIFADVPHTQTGLVFVIFSKKGADAAGIGAREIIRPKEESSLSSGSAGAWGGLQANFTLRQAACLA